MNDLYVGHINLALTLEGAGERFVHLIESLQSHNVRQHVIVRNVELAKRLDIVGGVTVGPCVRTAVTAYCLMPSVDVAHLHDSASWQAGLLLTLTKSIPYVTTEQPGRSRGNPINRAIRYRSLGVIRPEAADTCAHIRIYRNAADSLRVPSMIL